MSSSLSEQPSPGNADDSTHITGHRSSPVVNIEEALKTFQPRLYTKIPRFIIQLLKKLAHEEEINRGIAERESQNAVEFSQSVLNYFNIHLELRGIENLPSDSRPLIFISNHPTGTLDGPVLILLLSKYTQSFSILANAVLKKIIPLANKLIPIPVWGKMDKTVANTIKSILNSKQSIGIFPAGVVSRKSQGQIRDLEWKKFFLTQSIQHKRDVIPVHIDSKLSPLFYRLAYWRKKINIKANLEMFLLIDEMFKQKNRTITATLGEPLSHLKLSKMQREMGTANTINWVREQLYTLEKDAS